MQKRPIKINYYPNLSQTWGLVGIFFLATILVSLGSYLLTGILTGLDFFSANSIKGFVQFFIYTVAGLFVIWFGFREREKVEPNFETPYKKVPATLYLVLIPLTLSIGFLLEPVIEAIPMPESIKLLFEQMMSELFKSPFWAVVTVSLAAPFIEEWICRGIILEGLLKHFKQKPWVAILWSAFIFGFIHLNPWQFVSAFAIGILLGWLYFTFVSLLPCFFVHFLNNAVAALVSIIVENPNISTKDLLSSENQYYVLLSVAFLVLVVCLYLLKVVADKQKKEVVSL